MSSKVIQLIEGFNVSRETFDNLKSYNAELQRWNPSINLVARSTLSESWTRHIIDSAQVFAAAPSSTTWLDIGSGGGFPGMVAAIIGKEMCPKTRFTLMDSDQRKCTFLRSVIRKTDVNANAECVRVEQAEPHDVDVISSRALADLSTLLGFCERHLKANGTALLQKGASWENEVLQAEIDWKFSVKPLKSITAPKAVLLKIRDIARV